MTKKLFLPALVFAFAALCTTNSVGQCTTGVNPQYIAVGSSAQFNSFAYAAVQLLTNAGNGVNFWASSSAPLEDLNASVSDTATAWVAFDNQATCSVYAYFSVDSTVGVKDFFSYHKITQNGVTNADAAAVFVTTGMSSAACNGVVNAGLPACSGYSATSGGNNPLPADLYSFLTTQPGPTCKILGTTCTAQDGKSLPYAYCGQNSTTQTLAKFCFFNAGHADIRPEDTLYANTRALSSYNSTGGLAGLGYNATACGSNGGTTATIGCPFIDSFGQKKVFNVVKFALTGTDPIGLASLPAYTTLAVGAVPVLVIAADADSSGLGAGTATNSNTTTHYTITNVNRSVLSGIENGTFGCTGDLLYDGSGSGQPLQVIHREALSGTYNTFEFTGVRQMEASAAIGISDNKQTSLSWFTADDSGQEQVAETQGGPGFNWHALGSGNAACEAGNAKIGDTPPSAACGDPLYAPGVSCGSNGASLNLRAIGTGEMVKAVAQTYNADQSATDAFGYSFWGYGNLAPTGSGCSGTNTGAVTCSSYLAHYLTVNGIDPLFTTPGGANDSPANPNGGYHAPQCYLSGGSPDCFAVPFTNIYNGSYPLWTTLRLVTFNTVTTGTSQQTTPAAVLQILAEAEAAAANERTASVQNLGDFVPYLHHICPAGEQWSGTACVSGGSSTTYTGDLNLFVFRAHRKVAPNTTLPNDGIQACGGVYTGIAITGQKNGCTTDIGSDVGGAVITVNADADFNTDYGTQFATNGTGTYEYFGLLQ